MSLLALSLRSVVRGKRVVFVAAIPLLVGLVAVLLAVTADGANRTDAYAVLAAELLVLVVGLVGLVLGVNAFGDERDEGTLGLLLATTLPRPRIVLTKYAAAAAVTWLACLPATLGCLLLGVSATTRPAGTVVWSLLLATVLAAAAYAGLFVLLSLLLRRAVLVGLAYVVLWEGLLAGATTAFRHLSVSAYATRVAAAPWPVPPMEDAAEVSTLAAVLVLVVVAVVAVAGAAWRLPRAHL